MAAGRRLACRIRENVSSILRWSVSARCRTVPRKSSFAASVADMLVMSVNIGGQSPFPSSAVMVAGRLTPLRATLGYALNTEAVCAFKWRMPATLTSTTTVERYELARKIIDEIAASGRCADYIDVHESAKRRGCFDLEVDRLLAQKSIRDEVDAMCDKARGKPA